MKRITNTDLRIIERFQTEYRLALKREDYDAALQATNAIDQIFYEKGIDLVDSIERYGIVFTEIQKGINERINRERTQRKKRSTLYLGLCSHLQSRERRVE
jgi:hypothetical protein